MAFEVRHYNPTARLVLYLLLRVMNPYPGALDTVIRFLASTGGCYACRVFIKGQASQIEKRRRVLVHIIAEPVRNKDDAPQVLFRPIGADDVFVQFQVAMGHIQDCWTFYWVLCVLE